jgi:uncharacterized protein (TIGR02466 family)
VIIDLFSTSIYANSFELSDSEKNYLMSIPMNRNRDDDAWVSATNLHMNDEYKSIEQKICRHVHEYAYDNMFLSREYGLFCHGAWVNKNDTGDSTPVHHHSNSLISGVYYLQVDATKQGAIQFDAENGGPFGKFFTVLKYSQFNQRNTHRATIECRNDMIVLFPSVLKHSVAKNMSKTSRYSLAFDYMLSGEFDAMVNRMIYYK